MVELSGAGFRVTLGMSAVGTKETQHVSSWSFSQKGMKHREVKTPPAPTEPFSISRGQRAEGLCCGCSSCWLEKRHRETEKAPPKRVSPVLLQESRDRGVGTTTTVLVSQGSTYPESPICRASKRARPGDLPLRSQV